MTVHFFTRGDIRSSDSRHRAFQIAERLNMERMSAVVETPSALSLSLTPWPKKFHLVTELIRSLTHIKKGDVVYLQRTISNKYFFIIMVAYLLLFRPKMIFDFCDPVYEIHPVKTKIFAHMADAVIVSTHGQVEWAKRYNAQVHLIHISLDAAVYQKFTKDYGSANESPIIGWVGTAHNHMLNLRILAEVFTKLLARTQVPFTFLLVGAFHNKKVYEMFQSIPGLDVRFIDSLEYTDPESAPRIIQTFDIGVVPHISVTRWNKDKTSLKILEYMACGVATVASNAGELPYIIRDGENGYLADTEDEWVEKLTSLLSDMALRGRLGRAGQLTVREGYSFDVVVPRIAEIVRSLAETSSRHA